MMKIFLNSEKVCTIFVSLCMYRYSMDVHSKKISYVLVTGVFLTSLRGFAALDEMFDGSGKGR